MYLTPDDLQAFASIDLQKAAVMVEDVEAQAMQAAPCLKEPNRLDDQQRAFVKSVLRRAVLRWNSTGESGAVSTLQDTTGPFQVSQTITQRAGRLLTPAEVADLQGLCRELSNASQSNERAVFTVYTGGRRGMGHQPWCNTQMGEPAVCSCGASLTRYEYPLYEGGLLS